MIDFLEPRNCPHCGYYTFADTNDDDEVYYFCEECGNEEFIDDD